MKSTLRMAAAMIGILTVVPRTVPAQTTSPPSVVAVRVVTEAGEAHGTAALISRRDRGTQTTLHFLTSARLVRGGDSEGDQASPRIQLRLDAARTVDVQRDDVFLTGGLIDVAVLQAATGSDTPLRPLPLVYDPPNLGAVFLVHGIDDSGSLVTLPEHVRFASTLLATGDRDASRLIGCVGAPAVSPQGVFGIVHECEANRPPVISLLSMAQSFLERHLSRGTTSTVAAAPQFDMVERQVTQTIPLVACSATGDVDVSLQVGLREFVTDATAALLNPHEVHVTDLTVVKLEDRSLRLRFTLGGATMPPVPPDDCLRGQALIALHLRFAVAPNP